MPTRIRTVLSCLCFVSVAAVCGCVGAASAEPRGAGVAGPAERDWCLIAIRADRAGEGSAAYFLVPMAAGVEPPEWTIACTHLAGSVRVAGPVFGGFSRCEVMAGLRERADVNASTVPLEGGIGRVARVEGVYTGAVCESEIQRRRLPTTKMHHSYAFAFSPCAGSGVVVIAGMNNFIGSELDTLQGSVFADGAEALLARLEAAPRTRLVTVRRGMEHVVGQIEWDGARGGGLLRGLPPNDPGFLWIEPVLAAYGADLSGGGGDD